MHPPKPTDHEDLVSFGYAPSLNRTLGRFSAFAAGFSYLSIMTGMFQLFHVGYDLGGPSFFWTWPTFFAGQFLVALCFAELAAHYPLSGGVYQWSKHAGSRAMGWMAGWVYLASYLITLAAVALALQVTLPQIATLFQMVGDGTRDIDRAKNAVLLGCLLIAFTTVINSVGVGLMAKINNAGVFAELTGAVVLVVLLAIHARRSPGALFAEMAGRGPVAGAVELKSLLAAAMVASYVMYGFDTAGSLAEETNKPRRRVPGAILIALAAAAGLGALLMLSGMMAAGDLGDPRLSQDTGGLPFIVKDTLGDTLGKFFLCDVILAITVCALAVHAGTVRLIFAMARDNNLPFAGALARVSKRSRTPILPAVIVGIAGASILLLSASLPKIGSALAAVAIVWANLAYLLVTLPLLGRRFRGWPHTGGSGVKNVFNLGKWGLPINVAAVVWSACTIVNIGWPRVDIYGTAWYERYAAPLFTGVLLILGANYYLLVQRHRKGIVKEHRA